MVDGFEAEGNQKIHFHFDLDLGPAEKKMSQKMAEKTVHIHTNPHETKCPNQWKVSSFPRKRIS